MLQGEHSAILLTFIKQPFVIKIFVLSISELPLKTGFTVQSIVLKRGIILIMKKYGKQSLHPNTQPTDGYETVFFYLISFYLIECTSILRDFKNAPFYILCLFHMVNLRMFSLSFFIFLQN